MGILYGTFSGISWEYCLGYGDFTHGVVEGAMGGGLRINLDKLWISKDDHFQKGEFLDVHCKFGRSKSDLTLITQPYQDLK